MRRLLEDRGYWVCRAAGSLGDADLVALKAGESPSLVEVKATARGPYHGFGPKDRAELRYAAGVAGAQALLCWWPSRGKPQWVPEEDWPDYSLEGGDEE